MVERLATRTFIYGQWDIKIDIINHPHFEQPIAQVTFVGSWNSTQATAYDTQLVYADNGVKIPLGLKTRTQARVTRLLNQYRKFKL